MNTKEIHNYIDKAAEQVEIEWKKRREQTTHGEQIYKDIKKDKEKS